MPSPRQAMCAAVVLMMLSCQIPLVNAFAIMRPVPLVVRTQHSLFFSDNARHTESSSSSSSSQNNNNNKKQQQQRTSQQNKLIPKIVTVEKPEDYHDFLKKNNDDRLRVISFHAHWCKSCQKFGVKFHRLGLDRADVVRRGNDATLVQEGTIKLARVEFTSNLELCRSLGIKRLPNVHIYHPAVGLLDSFPCGPNKFPILVEKLDRYQQMTTAELQLEKTMRDGSELGDAIVQELHKENTKEQPPTAAATAAVAQNKNNGTIAETSDPQRPMNP